MKYALLALLLAGCAGTPQSLNLADTALSKFTHADLQNAAKIDIAHGAPARAAVWTAFDTQLTACEAAISAAAILPDATAGSFGVASAYETIALGIGQGGPSAVKLNCEPIVLPRAVFIK